MAFSISSGAAKRRLLISLHGKVKHGKTHFSLTAPGPIAIQNLDMGLDGVVQKVHGVKQVHVASYEGLKSADLKQMEPAQVAAKMGEVWDQFTADYNFALRHMRTVIVDTGTEAWEMCRLARLGKIANVKPHHYAIPNAEFRDLIREAENHDANLILTHRVKKEYRNEQWTGEYERAGFNDIGSWVHIVARCERREDGFWLVVNDCRQNPALNGQELPPLMANFPTLAQMVFPDSKLEDWQ